MQQTNLLWVWAYVSAFSNGDGGNGLV